MRAMTRESDVAKRSRKSKQVMEKQVEAVRAEAEGTTYEAGGFEYEGDKTPKNNFQSK